MEISLYERLNCGLMDAWAKIHIREHPDCEYRYDWSSLHARAESFFKVLGMKIGVLLSSISVFSA
jgi:hypothetical protein